MLVYKITNKVSGKAYIGITISEVRRRFLRHLKDARSGSEKCIHQAIRKYGPECFEVEEIACAQDWRALCDMERLLIHQHNTFYQRGGYNMTLGGEGSYGFSRPLTEEHRKKLSAAGKGKRKPDGFGERVSRSLKGRTFSEESRVKMAEAQRARYDREPISETTKARMSAAHKGKSKSTEQREKMAESRRLWHMRKRESTATSNQ